ncbi:site-2 protease family protein [Papillibacter cinnamivorans]|uniref:Peptidase M50 domain-containing protein n=1 Tax=Papillibacter cinnamivorans DSM 12816 TaxID=1122930 RepID=A0A1W1YU06_9FIRM|nr:site-2 protease family protein [Papillibacter cinnamivorans]SMC39593.1 hypothetical protein SAMN02745168_0652 [Papillibacter cinnamivorans DSM 12816]
MTLGRIQITGGFLLLLSLLFCFDRQHLLACFLVAAALHEAGHLLALRCVGGKVRCLRLTALGAEMVLDGRRLSYWGELAAALAGPGAGFLGAYAGALWGARGGGEAAYLFSGISFILSVFNLLPARSLDGGRALFSLLALLFSLRTAELVCRVSTVTVIGIVCLFGVFLLVISRGNFTLLAVGLWLLASDRREKKVVKRAYPR